MSDFLKRPKLHVLIHHMCVLQIDEEGYTSDRLTLQHLYTDIPYEAFTSKILRINDEEVLFENSETGEVLILKNSML